jgi:hypothetical protein
MLFLASSAFAATTDLKEKVASMAQITEQAMGAAEAALQVLNDLRQANYDAQDAANEQNKTQQAACDSEIADLHEIADSNKAAGDATTAHR